MEVKLIDTIPFLGSKIKVACDGNCSKAWGISQRPYVQLSGYCDDIAYLSDSELEQAPVNPQTYEDGHAKPLTTDDFPNKWCVRECERCIRLDLVTNKPLDLHDFSKRVYNQPWKHIT